jgi:hypothetical protein
MMVHATQIHPPDEIPPANGNPPGKGIAPPNRIAQANRIAPRRPKPPTDEMPHPDSGLPRAEFLCDAQAFRQTKPLAGARSFRQTKSGLQRGKPPRLRLTPISGRLDQHLETCELDSLLASMPFPARVRHGDRYQYACRRERRKGIPGMGGWLRLTNPAV